MPSQKIPASLRALLVCALAPVVLGPSVQAATISFVGVEPGTSGSGFAAQNWSNPGVAKEYDLSGNVYGTSGYYQIRPTPNSSPSDTSQSVSSGNDLGISATNNPTLYSTPVFLSSITGGAGTFVNFGGYPLFRGPDGSTLYRQGSLSVSVGGTAYNTPSGTNNGYFGNAFSFAMATNMGATFRIGVAVDTAGNGTYAPNYVSFYNSGTGTVFSGALTRDGTVDMPVFDITANAGESFVAAMWQLTNNASVAPFGLITFDVSSYNSDVASGTQTNSSVLSGSPAALLKTGAGTTVLTGVSTYQGTTTISNGAVEVGGSGQLASGNYSGAVSLATNSSSLRVNTTASQTLSGAISGSGSLVKSANGTLTLSGSNSYTGSTTISGGRVIANSTNALGDASTAITVSGGAYLQLGTNITRTGAVTFDGGYLSTANGSSLTKNGGSYVLTNAAEIVAVLGGTAGLTRGGAGLSVLWNSNTYTGATVVNGGTLRLDGTGNLSSSTTLQVDSGATFSMTGIFLTSNNVTVAGLTGAGTVYGGAGTLTVNKTTGQSDAFSGNIQGGIGVTQTGDGQFALAGSNSYTGVTSVSGGILNLADANGLGSTAAGTTVASGAVIRLQGTNAGGSGIAVGAEALTISGMGRGGSGGALRTVTGTNTWQGGITLAADARIGAASGSTLTIDVASGNAISSANFNLSVEGAGNIVVNDAISLGTGGLLKTNSSGSLTLAASNTYSGATVIQSGRLVLSGNGRLGSGAITISNANDGRLELAVTGTNVMANDISGNGGLVSSSGETRFTGAVTTTGGLTVSNSTVRIGNGGTTGSYSGGTVLSDVAAQLAVDRSDAYTHGGAISGSGSLIKYGSGTLTLTSLNSYSGGTFLNGGWLTAGHTNAFGTGSITVGSGTTLNLTNFVVGNQIVNNGGTILSTGTLSDVTATNGTTDIGGNNSTVAEVGGSATVNVSGSNVTVNQATGGTLNVSGSDARVATLSGGTVNANAAGLVVTNFNGGNIAVSNGLTVGLRGGSSSGLITGAGGVVKQSSDTLTLTANNTYTGATTVEAGKLVVNGSVSSATTVQSGATLGGSGTLASATIQSGGTIAPGNSPGTLTLTNGLIWQGGSHYEWQIYDANISGTPGQTNTWDLISVTGGSWDITGLSSTNKFNINLWSLSGLPNTTGTPLNFNPSSNYSWKILDLAGATAGFNTNLFNINTTAVNGTGGFVGATGLFALELNNNDLFLTYQGGGAAVPEPGTWAAGGMLLILAAGAAWRRKARLGSPS
jgi:autotransporter-associated beta strand protein